MTADSSPNPEYISGHRDDHRSCFLNNKVWLCWWYLLTVLFPNGRRWCQVKTALTFLLVYTLCWQDLRMGQNEGLEEAEDGNKEVTSPKFTQQPPHLPSRVSAWSLMRDPVELLRCRLKELWDAETGQARQGGRRVCVFVCVGVCLAFVFVTGAAFGK